jgi:hypothetical protein
MDDGVNEEKVLDGGYSQGCLFAGDYSYDDECSWKKRDDETKMDAWVVHI